MSRRAVALNFCRCATIACCALASSACQSPLRTDSTLPAKESATDIVTVSFEEPQDQLFESPSPIPAPPIEEIQPLAEANIQRLESDPRQTIDLDFAIHQAITNSAVIRDPQQFLSPANPLLRSPETVPSALDPEIQAASPFGTEAALAAFDAQLATGVQWGQDSLVQSNNFFASTVAPANILVSDSGSVYGRLDKATSTGGLLSLVHNWNYTPDNLPSRNFNSRYVGFLRTEWRQPLLAGRGWEYTDIAGPISLTQGKLSRGVRIARLDQEISTAEFNLATATTDQANPRGLFGICGWRSRTTNKQ